MNQSNVAGRVARGQEGTSFRAASSPITAGSGNNLAKRGLDIVVAGTALLLLSTPILLLMFLVRVKLGGPVFFRQTRPGLNGVPFKMVKFRTMTEQRGADGELLPDADRLTTFGKFLRSTSLDELPELWNVLKGDMSLVGPRPLLMEYLPLYTAFQARRHEVRPGITGWAQVNGRNGVDWDERFRLDVWYVNHRSFQLDLKILWLTVRCVLSREGVSAPGESTMSRFEGEQSQGRQA
jgi:lipopolysaccharide/colanic/teichoic acid biosynthesis glycosyltransferase